MKRFITLIFLIVFTTGLCLADDPARAKDLLRWFPDSGYSNVIFSNAQMVRESRIEKEYRGTFGEIDSNGLEQILLPEKLRKAIIVNCNGVLVETETIKETPKNNKGKRSNNRREIGQRFSILLIADSTTLITEELKKGSLSRAGFKLFKQPVYSLSGDTKKGKREGFLWVSPEGFLVLTSNKELMKLVAKTGMGRHPSFINNDENSRILNMANSLGQEWRLRFISSVKEQRIEKLIEKGGDYEKIEALEKALEQDMILEIVSFTLDKETTKTSYKLYQDNETAEKKAKEYKKSIKEAGVEIAADLAEEKEEFKQETDKNKLEKAVFQFVSLVLTDVKDTLETQKVTVDGDMVISTNTFGKKHYEIKVQTKGAREEMDKQVKMVVAKHKAEHGETE